MLNKVKSLWNGAKQTVVDFVVNTIEDFKTVWEFRPNVVIWFGILIVVALFI